MSKLLTPEIQLFIKRNALFVVNHSGGKDSQAMLIKIREIVPAEQILMIHSHLESIFEAKSVAIILILPHCPFKGFYIIQLDITLKGHSFFLSF